MSYILNYSYRCGNHDVIHSISILFLSHPSFIFPCRLPSCRLSQLLVALSFLLVHARLIQAKVPETYSLMQQSMHMMITPKTRLLALSTFSMTWTFPLAMILFWFMLLFMFACFLFYNSQYPHRYHSLHSLLQLSILNCVHLTSLIMIIVLSVI